MSTCRSCAAEIRWAKTPAGKAIPLDPDPHPDGNIVLSAATDPNHGDPIAVVLRAEEAAERRASGRQPLYRSHFASCKDSDSWRRR